MISVDLYGYRIHTILVLCSHYVSRGGVSFTIKELSDLRIPGANSSGLGSALASVVQVVEERELTAIRFLVS